MKNRDIRSDEDHGLAHKKLEALEAMMVSIVNLPDEEFAVTPSPRDETEFVNLAEYRAHRKSGKPLPQYLYKLYNPSQRPRVITERWWPELWREVPGQNTDVDTRAREVLFKMRRYLRKFWEAKDPEERDWYIFRAREWYERLRILPDILNYSESVRSTVADAMLDNPPSQNDIEKGLHHLQKRARFPSLAPKICPLDDCDSGERYFLSKKKGQKFCSEGCSQRNRLGIELRSYHKHKKTWPSTANRRKNRG